MSALSDLWRRYPASAWAPSSCARRCDRRSCPAFSCQVVVQPAGAASRCPALPQRLDGAEAWEARSRPSVRVARAARRRIPSALRRTEAHRCTRGCWVRPRSGRRSCRSRATASSKLRPRTLQSLPMSTSGNRSPPSHKYSSRGPRARGSRRRAWPVTQGVARGSHTPGHGVKSDGQQRARGNRSDASWNCVRSASAWSTLGWLTLAWFTLACSTLAGSAGMAWPAVRRRRAVMSGFRLAAASLDACSSAGPTSGRESSVRWRHEHSTSAAVTISSNRHHAGAAFSLGRDAYVMEIALPEFAKLTNDPGGEAMVEKCFRTGLLRRLLRGSAAAHCRWGPPPVRTSSAEVRHTEIPGCPPWRREPRTHP